MHSRIFVLRSRDDTKKDCCESIYDETGIMESINANYIDHRNPKDLKVDIDWFADVYDINVSIETIESVDDCSVEVGIIDSENVNKLIKRLDKRKQDRIYKAKKMLNQPIDKVDSYLVADAINPKHDFWFEYPGNGLINEADLRDIIAEDKPETIYITESYDYQF